MVKLASTVLATQLAGAPASVQVFPNPVSGTFTVQLAGFPARAGWQLELVKVLGSMVYRQVLPTAARAEVPA